MGTGWPDLVVVIIVVILPYRLFSLLYQVWIQGKHTMEQLQGEISVFPHLSERTSEGNVGKRRAGGTGQEEQVLPADFEAPHTLLLQEGDIRTPYSVCSRFDASVITSLPNFNYDL